MAERRLTVSEDYLGEVLSGVELRLVREIQSVKEGIPSEDRIRILAREEMGLATRSAWGLKSALITVGMFFIAVSTFLLTALRGSGHG